MLFFGLFWSAMVLLFDGFTVVPITRQVIALRFPSTDGVILSSEATQHEDNEDGTVFGVAFSYRYTVGGREYSGRRYRYQNASTSGSRWANRIVAANPPGAKVAVYYNPAHPQDALLAPGVSGGDLFQLMFMTPFNVVMLGFWWAGWARLRRIWFKPPAGGVKIVSRLKQTRVRLTALSPLATAMLTAAVLAFLSVFIVAFGLGGFHPTMRTMLAAWSVILAGSLGAGVWHWVQVISGRYDLIIDEFNSSLELPLTQGRKTRRRIPLASIESVYVETIQPPKKDNESESTPACAPTLKVCNEPNPTEWLVQWHDADKAQEFVEWLRDKLPVKKSSFRADKPGPDAS